MIRSSRDHTNNGGLRVDGEWLCPVTVEKDREAASPCRKIDVSSPMRRADLECAGLDGVNGGHKCSPFDFCDAGFSRLVSAALLTKRFIAAMTNTSSSVKPRVVIFHITASQLIRSIAALFRAKAMPNPATHVSLGKLQAISRA
jgi:hypothetical protein